MRVEYHPAVEAELKEIYRYYEDRVPGLGQEFIDEFERQVISIATAPEQWRVVSADLRRCLMRRIPLHYLLPTRGSGTGEDHGCEAPAKAS